MSQIIDAEYDGNVFIPIGQVNLKKHGKYRLIIDNEFELPQRDNVWEILKRNVGTVKGPEDWAENLDHYLYGTPKRSDEKIQE